MLFTENNGTLQENINIYKTLGVTAEAHFRLLGPHHYSVSEKDLSEDGKKIK